MSLQNGENSLWPTPTVEVPSDEQVNRWMLDVEDVETTDGCTIDEPDGTCDHGYPSWLVQLGIY